MAIQFLTSEGFVSFSDEAIAEMLLKHSQVPPPLCLSFPGPGPVEIVDKTVIKSIRSFQHGTAAGFSGLRAGHLKEALCCPSLRSSTMFSKFVCKFVNLLCAGGIPTPVVPYVCGASLIALKKKSGGLRPITVGEVLRRMVSKCISVSLSFHTVCSLSHLQVGVEVTVGYESIVHFSKTIQDDNSIPLESKWSLQVNFSNAFNSVDCHQMFEEIRTRIPSMAA